MKEDLSNYPEKFVYRIAKSLKADGFDFKPYYDHHFQDNLPIVEEASSLYGIDIPEDFFVALLLASKPLICASNSWGWE